MGRLGGSSLQPDTTPKIKTRGSEAFCAFNTLSSDDYLNEDALQECEIEEDTESVIEDNHTVNTLFINCMMTNVHSCSNITNPSNASNHAPPKTIWHTCTNSDQLFTGNVDSGDGGVICPTLLIPYRSQDGGHYRFRSLLDSGSTDTFITSHALSIMSGQVINEYVELRLKTLQGVEPKVTKQVINDDVTLSLS